MAILLAASSSLSTQSPHAQVVWSTLLEFCSERPRDSLMVACPALGLVELGPETCGQGHAVALDFLLDLLELGGRAVRQFLQDLDALH
ncbi:hypothetical protein PG994_003468 [Apiospora phragmitis]|uniref:Uncharacterized protein n=1 Tax=Apiospora phragmitis TaxID=2905665 RepID=A0ABR1VY51_9PEZI